MQLNQQRTDYRAQLIGAGTLRTSVLPQLPESIGRLIKATYAAHGGAEHMTLDDWRDLEQQLRCRFQSEHHAVMESPFSGSSRF